MINIHASCIKLKGKGVLIIGDSGSGKSDLCLRLITEFKAKLIADDRVDVQEYKGKLIASAPKILKGLLEVRGVGIIKLPFFNSCAIDMVVNLTNNFAEIERLPPSNFFEIYDIKVPQFNLYGKDISLPSKVIAAQSLL